ncbi:MAG: DNA translocase FtsK 4TM domain-containing protein [Candidatus Levybacteria bacterium]|nr:DNA translocase FtsK 4TM domain-containing protein [Candidatus Levybacteria bacterium]
MRVKRKTTRRRRVKLKLKKNTIYNVFAIGSFLLAFLFFLSYTQSGDSLIILNDVLVRLFGGFSLLLPMSLLFLGFFMLRLKTYISRPNVFIGFLLASISLSSLFRTGEFGAQVHTILAEILTVAGANIVFIAGVIIGVIVFFDTSVDEIMRAVKAIVKTMPKIFPVGAVSGGFKKNEAKFDRQRDLWS